MDQTILKEEVAMLDNMIAQVGSQVKEGEENLKKLETVRDALKSCIDDDEQLELELVN